MPQGVPNRVARVVLVDDRPQRRGVLRELLLAADVGPDIGEADDVGGVVAMVDAERIDVVVLERRLPVQGVLAAIAALRSRLPLVWIVISSFGSDDQTEELEVAAGANAHLAKPLRAADVRQMIERGRGSGLPGSGALPMSCGPGLSVWPSPRVPA
jgi:CheY-like chemotaxis protein